MQNLFNRAIRFAFNTIFVSTPIAVYFGVMILWYLTVKPDFAAMGQVRSFFTILLVILTAAVTALATIRTITPGLHAMRKMFPQFNFGFFEN